MPRKGDFKVWPFVDADDPWGLVVLMRLHTEALRVRGRERSARAAESTLSQFIVFCQERGITKAKEVTKPIVERYQRYLFYYRKADGSPLNLSTQIGYLQGVRLFFRWLARQNYLPSNPASEIELPRLPHRLPNTLTRSQVELILSSPDIGTDVGLRDRAILETFYSTAIRRAELCKLKFFDLDPEGGLLAVRQGKGSKDRLVPIGERALAWVDRYLFDVRPRFLIEPDEGFLFLSVTGRPLVPDMLGMLVARHVAASGVGIRGACHLFRHTAATLMLEGGADVRYIQQLLGHANLDTTALYTHVSIRKLKEVHSATHPGAKLHAQAQDAPEDDEPEGKGKDQG